MLSLGSNLGERLANLRLGLETVAAKVPVRAVSPVYETEPVGGPEQPRYLNAVALVETEDAWLLLELAQDAERRAGRVRSERWGPRTLDVDIVSVDDVHLTDPTLTLPHPRAHERAFVLVPWHDVDPAARLPGHGQVVDLLTTVDRSGLRRRDDLSLARAAG